MEIFLVSQFPISNRTKNSLIDNGILSVEDLKKLTLDDLKNLDGIGSNALKEIREYVYVAFKIIFKPVKKEKKKKLNNFNEARAVVDHFLKGKSGINWPLQLKKAEMLLEKFSIQFLLSVEPPPNIYSLGYFFNEFGNKYLTSKMPARIIKEDPKLEPVHSKEELEGIEYIPNDHTKPKNLKDFLGI
jgi:hypothetical protein